jgi:hypothetical protein
MFLALILAATVAAAPSSPSPQVAEARRLVDALEYDKALKVIDAAFAQGGLEREAQVSLYELSAIAWATLGKSAKAKEAFQALLSLAPDFQLSKNLPPRTRTPFFEAKTWLAGASPVSADVEPVRDGAALNELVVTVKDNALVTARSLRVTLTGSGAPGEPRPFALDGKRAVIPLGGSAVAAWKVEVLGDRGVLHVALGEARAPNVSAARPPPELLPLPPPPPAAALVTPAEAPPRAWMRPTGVVVGAAGVAALLGGGLFGFLSSDARAKVVDAERDPMGVVTGITQREAAEYDAAARSNATIANVLFVTGGVLAASGLGLFLFGGRGASADAGATGVSLMVTPGGAAVSGHF